MFSKPKYLRNGNTACVWDVSWNRTENVLSQVYSSQRGLPCELKTPVKSDVTVGCRRVESQLQPIELDFVQ